MCVCVCVSVRARPHAHAYVYIYVYMIMCLLTSDLQKLRLAPDLPKRNYFISQEGSGDEINFSLSFHTFSTSGL